MVEATPAEIAWAHAVRELFAERMAVHVPVPETFEDGPPLRQDWDMARATIEAQEPALVRDVWRTFELLGDGAHAADVFALADSSTPADFAFEGPLGEVRDELDRLVTGAATARAGGDAVRADAFTEEAGRVRVAVDELQRDAAASMDGRPDPALVAAELEWLRVQRDDAWSSTPDDLPRVRMVMPRGDRDAFDAGMAQISQRQVAWATAVRAVHAERVAAEARRIAGLGVRSAGEADLDARHAVHLRDPRLAQQHPRSVETLIREGALQVTDAAPNPQLRAQHRALAIRHDDVGEEYHSARFHGQRSKPDLEAEISALQSAIGDLAVDHGHDPDAFRRADEADWAARPAPRRRGLDLRPKLPRRPERPTPGSLANEHTSGTGPQHSGPGLR